MLKEKAASFLGTAFLVISLYNVFTASIIDLILATIKIPEDVPIFFDVFLFQIIHSYSRIQRLPNRRM